MKRWFVGMHEVGDSGAVELSANECPEYAAVALDDETIERIRAARDFMESFPGTSVNVEVEVDFASYDAEEMTGVVSTELRLEKIASWLSGMFDRDGHLESNPVSTAALMAFIDSEDRYRFDIPDFMGNTKLTEEKKDQLMAGFSGDVSENRVIGDELHVEFREKDLLAQAPAASKAPSVGGI